MRLLIMEEFEISVSRDREVFHYTVVNKGTDRSTLLPLVLIFRCVSLLITS